MFGIVFAFSYLGRDDSNAGAALLVGAPGAASVPGYLSGWALDRLRADLHGHRDVPGRLDAARALLDLGRVEQDARDHLRRGVLPAHGGARSPRGVTVTVTVQIIMSCIESVLLLLFAALAIFHAHHVTAFSWHWFSPSIFHAQLVRLLRPARSLAAFYYWGWDVTANLNEETKSRRRPRASGASSGSSSSSCSSKSSRSPPTSSLTRAPDLQPEQRRRHPQRPGPSRVARHRAASCIVAAVLLSTVATLETTLIQVTRTLFAMGRDNTLPKVLGRIHPEFQDAVRRHRRRDRVISLLLFVGDQSLGSIANILSDGINSIGLQICIYYGLAGLAVVILYRRQLFNSVTNFIFMGLWPLVGADLHGRHVRQGHTHPRRHDLWVGLGAMALGLIPMFYYWSKKNPYYEMPSKEDRHAVVEEFEQNL